MHGARLNKQEQQTRDIPSGFQADPPAESCRQELTWGMDGRLAIYCSTITNTTRWMREGLE